MLAVEPAYKSQNCSSGPEKVVKTLSTRTHKCPHCGYEVERDVSVAPPQEANGAINLKSAVCT
ncbi:MAG: zinc ribbon domain-containing protein [Microcoleaceae cyanobacterium]